MALFDSMPGMDTPEGQGLLAAAFSLLQARKMPGDRGIGGALGAAGQQYMGARSQAQDQMQRRKFQDLQMRGQQAQLDQAEEVRKREQAALALRAQYQRPEGFDYQGYAQALAASDPMAALDLKERLNKKKSPIAVAPGTGLVDSETFQPVYTQPDRPQAPEKDPEAIRSLKIIYGEGTPAYQAALKRLGDKTTSHQPGVSVTYGAPVAGVDVNGKPVFFQPSKDGGAPSIIAGVAPPDKADPVEFSKSVAGLKELANGLDSYEKTMRDAGGINPMALGKNKAALQSSYTTLQMGLKNAFELGALAGPDLSLLQGMLVDPTSPQAVMIGDKGVAEQISKARQYLKNRGKAVYEAHRKPVPPEYAAPMNVDDLVNKYRSK